jgi:hypothetical protein
MCCTLAVACSYASGRTISSDGAALSSRERHEAIVFIQDDTGKGPFIDDDDIVPVARAIRLVRRAFPEGDDIVPNASSGLEIRLSDSAAHVMTSRFPAGWKGDTVLHTLGLASIDSVNSALGVRSIHVYAFDFGSRSWLLVPSFTRPIYRRTVADQYNGVQGIRFTPYGRMLGDYGEVSLGRSGTIYTFRFSRKWGDCPAGCISGHYWIFEVDMRTRRVRTVREYGDPLPPRRPPAA